jgi:hypothetical protein
MAKFRILALLLFLPAALFAQEQSAAKVYAIGERGPAGGWVFYDKGSYTEGWRYLEAAPADLSDAEWGAVDKGMAGTETRTGSGKRNTERIVAKLKDLGEGGKAAQLCAGYELNGYRDWFLPSKDELDLMYINLHTEGLGGFKESSWYWSSSEYDDGNAWYQSFEGYQHLDYKYCSNYVRAARAF